EIGGVTRYRGSGYGTAAVEYSEINHLLRRTKDWRDWISGRLDIMSHLLAGKVAVITGGTRGLGLAIATEYARAGAAVVVASRSQAAVDSAVEQLRKSGLQASGIACNVSDLAQVQSVAAHATEAF